MMLRESQLDAEQKSGERLTLIMLRCINEGIRLGRISWRGRSGILNTQDKFGDVDVNVYSLSTEQFVLSVDSPTSAPYSLTTFRMMAINTASLVRMEDARLTVNERGPRQLRDISQISFKSCVLTATG